MAIVMMLGGYSTGVAEAKPKACVVEIELWGGKTYRYSCSFWVSPGKLKPYKMWT